MVAGRKQTSTAPASETLPNSSSGTKARFGFWNEKPSTSKSSVWKMHNHFRPILRLLEELKLFDLSQISKLLFIL